MLAASEGLKLDITRWLAEEGLVVFGVALQSLRHHLSRCFSEGGHTQVFRIDFRQVTKHDLRTSIHLGLVTNRSDVEVMDLESFETSQDTSSGILGQ